MIVLIEKNLWSKICYPQVDEYVVKGPLCEVTAFKKK